MSLGLASQATLYWKFTNPQLVPGAPYQFKFDVELASSATNNIVGMQLVLNYDAIAFGAPAQVTIAGGVDFNGFTVAGPTVTPSTISYQMFTFGPGAPLIANTYVKFCSVTIDVDDYCGNAGILFNQTMMNGQSFYYPYNLYTNSYVNDLSGSFGYEPASTTWTGDVDADWDDPSNWTDCVPGASSAAIIPLVATVSPILNINAVVDDLTIQPGGALTIPAAFTFAVTSNLLIESDATGTGSLINEGASVLSGTVERNLKGWGSYSALLKNGHGWHLLSSPVAAQAILPFQDLTDNDDFFKWNEPANVWKNRRQVGGGTVPDPAFDIQFEVGAGYLVAYEADKDFEFDGVLNTADVPVGALSNSWVSGSLHYFGHHLLGNPYPSALTWGNAAWNRTSVASHAQIWHEANASYSVLAPGDPIPAMQGFFVYTTGGGSLTIPAAERVHDATPFYKSASDQIVLSAHDLDHQMKQESKVAFNTEATEGFDMEYDAYFMGGYAPRFYSVSEGAGFALNTLPAMTENLVIPFTFVKNEGTNFEITLDAALDYGTMYLVDNKTNVTVNLTQTGSYSFVAAQGDDANRFLLKFGAVGIDDPIANKAAIEIFSAGDVLYLNALKSGDATVSVFDLLGRMVLTTEVYMTPSATVDVSRLSGTYIVRAIANGEVVSAKVFIK
jgi:hypothetical protein